MKDNWSCKLQHLNAAKLLAAEPSRSLCPHISVAAVVAAGVGATTTAAVAAACAASTSVSRRRRPLGQQGSHLPRQRRMTSGGDAVSGVQAQTADHGVACDEQSPKDVRHGFLPRVAARPTQAEEPLVFEPRLRHEPRLLRFPTHHGHGEHALLEDVGRVQQQAVQYGRHRVPRVKVDIQLCRLLTVRRQCLGGER